MDDSGSRSLFAYYRHSNAPNKYEAFRKMPRKVVPSKKSYNSEDGKSCSAGSINNIKRPSVIKPKKTTKSDVNFSRKAGKKEYMDYCNKCGDVYSKTDRNDKTASNTKTKNVTKGSTHKNFENKHAKTTKQLRNNVSQTTDPIKFQPYKSIEKLTNKKKLQQYYKNENFQQSSDSIHDIEENMKKISLDTIKEIPESHISKSHSSESIKIYPDSDDEEIGYLDIHNDENLKQIKEFRQRNYFECHSAKSRIENRGSVTSLKDHNCVYRFYLNDRLFPVPLHTDNNNNIRCVQCHLPLNLGDKENILKTNGAIQAKVKIGDATKDFTLLLPIKEPLIIKERRKNIVDDVLYFGVIKLDSNGDSMFNRTLPNDSFALKYQKGYKEYHNDSCRYEKGQKNDVIII